MHRHMGKVTDLSLAGCLLFLFIIGCSTKPHPLWRKIFSQDRELISPRNEVGRFDSKGSPKRGDPNSRYLLACYYQEQGKHRKAIDEFKKILLSDPRNVKVFNGMGVCYDMIGEFPEAIESYKRALELKDNLDYVHNNQGYSYLLQGNPDEAIRCFQRAIALNGQNGQFHNNLGLAYATKGQMNLAMAEFKLAGDESKAYSTLAQFYSRRRPYHEDHRPYSEALTLEPSVTQGHDSSDTLEALARSSQPEADKLEDKDLNSRPLPSEESEIKEEMLPPAILKSNEEQPSDTEIHVAGFSVKDSADIGEMADKQVEAFTTEEETEKKREAPAIDYFAWRKKPIGQRALELASTEPDKKILETLQKEYGKEQLDQWLGISRGNEEIKTKPPY